MKATTQDAYRLLHEGTLALSRMEHNGIRVDEAYLEQAGKDYEKDIKDTEARMREDEVFRVWRKRFGDKANVGSSVQLATVLFDEMKVPYLWERTPTGRHKTGEEILSQVDVPFVKDYLRLGDLRKDKSTYLDGIKREIVDGYIHPVFSLNTVRTYRSSSELPNFQNFPIRDPVRGKLIRRCFIPRKGHVLVDDDYSGIEVRISACYNKDPNLIKYIEDPTTDMHRDTAAELFLIDKSQVEKRTTRDWAKNRFVFPEFYGSVYFQCAPHLWEAVKDGKSKLPSGVSILDHLKAQGITELGDCGPKASPTPGSFVSHVRKVEKLFWEQRFGVYHQWKSDWYNHYRKRGWFEMKTGFRCEGVFKRNEVINYPVQGCLARGSRVLTDQGWLPIESLVDRSVNIWTGFRWASAVGLNRGRCQRAVVRLDSGLAIRCDIRHKFKNHFGEWVDFADLLVGSWVALPKNNHPLESSEGINWWFVFGFIIGDGCISSKRRSTVSITVGQKKQGILKGIYHFLLEQGYKEGGYGGVHWDVIPSSGKRAEKYRLVLENEAFAAFLRSKGFIFGWKSHTKRVPSSVWYASLQEQRDFMEGLWLSDGCRGHWSYRNLNMMGAGLLRDVQKLSSALGFDSIRKGIRLRFHWRDFNVKSPRKFPAEALMRQVEGVCKSNYEDECEYITDHRNYSQAKKGVNPSQYVAERIIERNSRRPEIYRYDRVESIEVLDKEEDTYTMCVDDPLHQFVADGVIHQNSAFHCLLQSIIILQKRIVKRRMKTKLVGQIHDSIIADVPKGELQEYLTLAREVMTRIVPARWPWIIVPLEVEAEVAEANWHEKVKYEEKDREWKSAT